MCTVVLQGLLKNVASTGMLFWSPIIVAAILEGRSLSTDPVTAASLLKSAAAARAAVVGGNIHSTSLVPRLAGRLAASNSSMQPGGSTTARMGLPPASNVQQLQRRLLEAAGEAAGAVVPGGTPILSVLLVSLPYVGSAFFSLWLGHRAQRMGERAVHLAVPYFLAGLLFASFPRIAAASAPAAFVALFVVITCTHVSARGVPLHPQLLWRCLW